MSEKVTITDVARKAGVSLSTVSNLLNGRSKRMRPSTEQRILDAIEELGYRPNAAAAEILGFEIEATAIPMDDALIQLGIGYLDAEYVELDASVANLQITDDLINAPKWNLNVAAQYDYSLGDWGTLTPRLDLSYSSEVANDAQNTPQIMQPSYALLNLSMTWRDANDRWSATIAGNNVTDETYLVTGFAGSGIIEGVYGLPATWAFTVRRNFN